MMDDFATPQTLAAALQSVGYVTDGGLATAVFLSLRLQKPLLLEGAPGVGKTEAARALAGLLGRDLVRLQCYEGIDPAAALYEWNYQRQLLAIRRAGDAEIDLYGDAFLIERPLLQVLRDGGRYLLLIDEIDRSDHEFEALLLEFLSDFQISIPERGTIAASIPPIVILTSNRTRDLAEALRRRCIYHHIDFPDATREMAIIELRAPGIAERTARAVARAVRALRTYPLAKPPGIAEAIDWARGITALQDAGQPWPTAFRQALGLVVKDDDDAALLEDSLDALIEEATT